MFRSHRFRHRQSETLESQSWSTVVDSLVLMDRNGLKEFIHVLIGLIYHGKQHHWRIWSQIRKFPKIETGPVILTAKNGNFLIPNLHHDTSFKWIFFQTWKLKILFSHFQKVQELPNPMYGCQDMINSFSSIFELQLSISLKPFGQIWWGFFQQVTFDLLFPKM